MRYMTLVAAVLLVAACSKGTRGNAGTSETAAGAVTPSPDTTGATRMDTGMSRTDTSMRNDTSMRHDTSQTGAKRDTGSSQH